MSSVTAPGDTLTVLRVLEVLEVLEVLVVRSVRCGRKSYVFQIGAELRGEDTCESVEVAGEGCGFPAAGVVVKAESIGVSGEWRKTDDGLLVDVDKEEAAVGPDGDVVVTPIGTDCGGKDIRMIGERGTAPGAPFGRGHRDSYALRASGSSAWSG
jgi:hypothetical protein